MQVWRAGWHPMLWCVGRPCRYFWAACGILGVTGSQLWTYKLVRGFMKQRRTQPAASAVSRKAR